MPVSRMGWHAYYVRLYNKTLRDTAAQLALVYYLLAVADDEVQP